MTNGVPTTLSVSLSNLSSWSDINGVGASTVPAAFAADLLNVTRCGVAFGSGYFAAQGLAFNDPGATATFQVEGMAPVPEPSTLVLLGFGAVSLFAYAWRRRKTAA